MAYKSFNIENLGQNILAKDEVLMVRFNKRKYLKSVIVAGLFLGLIVFVSFYVELSAIFIGLALLMSCLFFIISINDYVKPKTWVVVNQKEVVFFEKDKYGWNEIDKIVYEKDMSNEGSDFLTLYLKRDEKVSISVSPYLDHPIEVIAAYVNKYWTSSIDV